MADTFRADDYDTYRMDYGNPHRELEPLEDEVAVVDGNAAVCDRGYRRPRRRVAERRCVLGGGIEIA